MKKLECPLLMRVVRIHGKHFNSRQVSDLTLRLWDESPFEACVCVCVGGGALMHGIKVLQQDFGLKLQGGLCAKEGVYLQDTTVHGLTKKHLSRP